MLFVALTAFLGLFALWVFVILFIRLLGFMTSPNPNKLKNKLYPVEEDSMHGIYSHYDNETESIVLNIIYPEYDTFMVDYKIDWKKFKKCSGRGAQTRIQHDHIGDPLKLDFSLLFHVRKFTLDIFFITIIYRSIQLMFGLDLYKIGFSTPLHISFLLK